MADDKPAPETQPQPVRCWHCERSFRNQQAVAAHLKAARKPAVDSCAQAARRAARAEIAQKGLESQENCAQAAVRSFPLSSSTEDKASAASEEEGRERPPATPPPADPYLRSVEDPKVDALLRGYRDRLARYGDDPEEDAPVPVPRLSRKAAATLWEKKYKGHYEPYLRGIFTMWLKGRSLSEKQEGIVDSILAELEAFAEEDAESLRQALADRERETERARQNQEWRDRRATEDAEYTAQREKLSTSLEQHGRAPGGWELVSDRNYPGGARWLPPEQAARHAARKRAEAAAEQILADAFGPFELVEAPTASGDNGGGDRTEDRGPGVLLEETNTDAEDHDVPTLRKPVNQSADG